MIAVIVVIECPDDCGAYEIVAVARNGTVTIMHHEG